jgi:hypothetical protein
MALWEEWQRLYAQRQAWIDMPDGKELDDLWARRFELEETAARYLSASRRDLQIKLALGNAMIAEAGDDEELVHPILLSVFRDVERMLLVGKLS